jgi:hypothetical protein
VRNAATTARLPRSGAGRFAELMTRDAENGETSPFLWKRLEVSLEENFDGLFTGGNLDTDRSVVKVDLVASSVLSANDRVGHYYLAPMRRRR